MDAARPFVPPHEQELIGSRQERDCPQRRAAGRRFPIYAGYLEPDPHKVSEIVPTVPNRNAA